MTCLHAWRRTGYESSTPSEPVVDVKGEVGNVWAGKDRHMLYTPCSDLLFVYLLIINPYYLI